MLESILDNIRKILYNNTPQILYKESFCWIKYTIKLAVSGERRVQSEHKISFWSLG